MARSLIVTAAACFAVAACGSPGNEAGQSPATASSAVAQRAPGSTAAASTTPTTTTTTPQCIGLSICPPPPPDAEGNPACYYADGWRAVTPGAGIEVWYFHEPQNMSKPDKVRAVVRRKDGTNQSQDANVEAGQQVHRFEFPDIEQSSVDEVLLISTTGRCFVVGPGG